MKREKLFAKFNNVKLDFNSRILLLTHTDMDGSGSSILFKSIFPNVDTIYCANGVMDKTICDYATNEDTFENYDLIMVTDISCKKETADKIATCAFAKDKIVILDHHKTTLQLNDFDFAVVTNENPIDSFNAEYFVDALGCASGTSLAYDFLLYKGFDVSNHKMAAFLAHSIAAYDTWDWVNVFDKNKHYTRLNALFYILGAEYFEDNFVSKVRSSLPITDFFSSNDNLMLEIEEKKIKDYCERKAKCIMVFDAKINKRVYSIALVSAENHLSNVFDTMNELYPDVDIYIADTGSSLSLRTRKDNIDVSEIAKIAGGGGHTQASGCYPNKKLRKLLVTKTLKTSFLENLLSIIKK